MQVTLGFYKTIMQVTQGFYKTIMQVTLGFYKTIMKVTLGFYKTIMQVTNSRVLQDHHEGNSRFLWTIMQVNHVYFSKYKKNY